MASSDKKADIAVSSGAASAVNAESAGMPKKACPRCSKRELEQKFDRCVSDGVVKIGKLRMHMQIQYSNIHVV
jgi:hypothetical protein